MPTRPADDDISIEFILGIDGNDVDADDIPIEDAGSYFTSTEVEGALQELGAAMGGGGGGGGTPAFKGVHVTTTSTQNVTDGSFPWFTAWSTVVSDADSWADLGGAHPERLVAPYDCIVRVDVFIWCESHANGQRAMYLYRNQTAALDEDIIIGSAANSLVEGQTLHMNLGRASLSSGQYLGVQVAQDSGVTLGMGGDFGGSPAYFIITVLELT